MVKRRPLTYKAAREGNERASEVDERDEVSSALIEKVKLSDLIATCAHFCIF